MSGLKIASLFSGVGGFEVGLKASGHRTILLCENDPAAKAVLSSRFPKTPLHEDIRDLDHLPSCDVITAGWPCQDISQAGATRGLRGKNSGLVKNLLDVIERTKPRPSVVLLENVAFILHLQAGAAMDYVTERLERLGYAWAYRVLDTRLFGLPQRRRRVFLVATRDVDPRRVLFSALPRNMAPQHHRADAPCGFYWTEGNGGIGWAVNAVPPLKGGSSLSIPSPPGIWQRRSKQFVVPKIQAAERLQGFPVDWTAPASDLSKSGDRVRWRLVGNAVSVNVSVWLGKRLSKPLDHTPKQESRARANGKWPSVAWGAKGKSYEGAFTWEGPDHIAPSRLNDVLARDTAPLSQRAAQGFLTRLLKSSLRAPDDFKRDLAKYAA